MQRLVAVGLFLAAARLSAVPCAPTATRLCLNGNRFAAEVTWRDFQGNTGSGHPVSLTGDTGYFWFFSSTNVELVVKALDGRGINNNYWIFYGALSNVEYTMTVTDTVTGRTKVYANASGNLGSVADTSAFAAAGAFPSARAGGVRNPQSGERNGDTASASASCAPTATSLCLNGGRFRAEVSWRDFAGNKGVGQAVALTADTGYFWFFNAANVELVVKVLDGRAVTKSFWVFYGALSTVQYQLKVTDTVSGRTTYYFNPANELASVADTSALGDGAFVQAVHDTSRAVTETIPTSGGTISTIGADGSRFTLEFPAGALSSEHEITLTPVSSIGSLPLSGGLAAAVHIEPEGLVLHDSATLTIEPAVAVTRAQAIPFSYQGNGAEFFLQPPLPVAGAIQLPVFHLTGFGIGRGTQSDIDGQAARLPTLDVDQLAQRVAVVVLPAFRSGAFGSASAGSGAMPQAARACPYVDYLRGEYVDTVVPRLLGIVGDCVKLRIRLPALRQYIRTVQVLGCAAELDRELGNTKDVILSAESGCFDRAFTGCVQDKDPAQVEEIERWAIELRRDGHPEVADPAKEHRCLRFELDFDSSIRAHGEEVASVQWDSTSDVSTVRNIPIEFDASTGFLAGTGTLDYLSAFFLGKAEASCTVTMAPKAGGTFSIPQLDIAVDTSLIYAPTVLPRLRLHYEPGRPTEAVRKVCILPTLDETNTTTVFRMAYDVTHDSEFEFAFPSGGSTFRLFSDLELVGTHQQYAGRVYDLPDFLNPGEPPESPFHRITERTAITLFHTPR
ncbi:MAG TPA: hypothetical protein VE007_10520 [Thermoanaerobaculia bacterium]|nr:hypothetical protein [Thermoanaerobaculia bacterium]